MSSATETVAPRMWDELLGSLPSPRVIPGARASIARSLKESGSRLIVVDDDPTGSQTVRDVTLLMGWEESELRRALGPDGTSVTFVLTNTRALDEATACRINHEIGRRVALLASELDVPVRLLSRGDSTLRGHFPAETEALAEGWGGVDGVVFCPAFIDSGRVTIEDIHWLREGSWAIPVGESEFAGDSSFGFESSRLSEFLAERGSRVDTVSLSLTEIRTMGPSRVEEVLAGLNGGTIAIANVADEADLDVLALGLLAAEERGKRFIYRTAPSFVAARTGQSPGGTLGSHTIYPEPRPGHGLIVVGSHTDLTNRQLESLRSRRQFHDVEINVERLLSSDECDAEIADASALGEQFLTTNEVILSTSRLVRRGGSSLDSLRLSRQISAGLVEVVRRLAEHSSLRFLLAKGGITSHDIATRALHARRATVLGQLLPGRVSVWRLEALGGLPLAVFPGNVGADNALAIAVETLAGGRRR